MNELIKKNCTIKSIKAHIARQLLIVIFLTFELVSVAFAVTDEELEALEKQIEQKEIEEVKQAEAVAKRKAELKKQKIEEEHQQLEEEKHRLIEEKRKLEEARLVELERKRQEVARKKAEEKKYKLLITEAEQALSNKDKDMALSKYKEILSLIPGDPVATSGIKSAEKLMDKFCYQLIGTWKEQYGDITKFYENGIVAFKSSIVSYEHHWQCNPEQRQIIMNYLNNDNPGYITSFKLSNDNKKLYFADRNAFYAEKISDGYID